MRFKGARRIIRTVYQKCGVGDRLGDGVAEGVYCTRRPTKAIKH